jgi:hypothetical protein
MGRRYISATIEKFFFDKTWQLPLIEPVNFKNIK